MRFPTPTNPATNHRSGQVRLGCPFHDGLDTPVQFQTDGAPLVGPLFPHGGPTTVGRVVMAVRVIPFDGVPRRARPHVLVEHLEGLPTGAHGNPPPSVVRPRHIVWIGTPGEHRPPRLVFGGTRKSVGRIALLATARSLPSRGKVFQQHLRRTPARTSNLNAAMFVPLLGKITEHHKVIERVPRDHYNTSLLAATTGLRPPRTEVAQVPYPYLSADAPDLDTSRTSSRRGVPKHRPETIHLGGLFHAPEITIMGCWVST